MAVQGSILYRAAAGAAALALLAGVAAAQRRAPRKPQTPRALALVEWPAKGAPRLVPICILVDGRFYDASIYQADPVPLALDPGNVYQVEHSGDPEGFFTVRQAAQQGDNWFGVGSYATMKALEEAERAPSKAGATKAATESDEPPRLRRPKSGEEEKPAAAGSEAPKSSDEPATLRKPATEAGAGATTAASAPAADEDADPNRPRLRRGPPASQIALETMETPTSAVAASDAPHPAAAPGAVAQNPATPTRVLAAISDAKGPDPRSYAFDWTAQEQERIRAGMEELGKASLQEYLKNRNQAAGALQDVQVKAFDLDLSNEAVFVLTATAQPAPPAPARRGAKAAPAPEVPAKPLTYYVTVIARENLEGKLRRIFRRVTDSGHLDAYSRFELIDAVDADGDGRGELLFRAINDQTRRFVLYRVGVDGLTELYNSGELER